jgi:CheY-like chemotaxis protein
MIDNTAKLFSASALKKKVDIKLKIEKDVPQFIISDQYRVEQVLSNLLNNAIKFSNQSSDVELKVKVIKKDSQNVELDFSVKDDGIGLTEVEQKYIFDEFKQADSSTVRNYGGTGLGLSISLKIAKILGGDIKVKSKKDHGSIFSFFLKAEKGAEIKNSFNEEVDQKLAKKHPHEILIVEDNKVNQKVASKLLARCGYICDIADDGEKAVAACQQKNYTLIFMDLQMPNMNGLTASQIILKEHPEIKIVAMTANILEEERARCFEVGMKSFIGKPFVLNDLIKVIKQLET